MVQKERMQTTETLTLTPQEAAQVFADARRWQQSLGQRTEGITWMVWGAITPAIFMTLGFMTSLKLPAWAVVVGWTSWVLVGYLITFAIWRSAALARHADVRAPNLQAYLVKSLAIVALVLLLHFVIQPQTMAGPMSLIGIGWIAMGLFATRISQLGRRVSVSAGGLVLLSALILELLAPPMLATMLAGSALIGLIPLLAGLYETLQG